MKEHTQLPFSVYDVVLLYVHVGGMDGAFVFECMVFWLAVFSNI
jgi:hypothetical protein